MNKTILILALSIACAALLLLVQMMRSTSTPRDNPNRITYYQLGVTAPSFDIANADLGTNAFYLRHLVGTLVSYEEKGRSEPYLAQSWDVTNQGRTWTFNLRAGLRCENGEEIVAEQFQDTLERTLRRFHEKFKSNVPIFSHLEGWEKFPGQRLSGIQASGQTLTFKFTMPIQEGLLEYLSMPAFGYHCAANFDGEGNWINSNGIVSSGPYSLVAWDGKSKIEMKGRKDWPLLANGAVHHLVVEREMPDLNKIYTEPTVIDYPDDIPFDEDKFTLVRSTPSWLFAYILLPTGSGAFKSLKNRIAVLNKIRQLQNSRPYKSVRYDNSTVFYPTQSTPVRNPHDALLDHDIHTPITIASYHSPIGHHIYLQSLLTSALDELGIEWKMVRLDRSSPTFHNDLMNGDWDIRMMGVDIGGAIENWGIEMMFCSKLGASLADPSGRICQLVKEFDRGEVSYQDYIGRFNDALYEDAATIPILHGITPWLFSKHFDLSKVPPTMTLVALEFLRFKESE